MVQTLENHIQSLIKDADKQHCGHFFNVSVLYQAKDTKNINDDIFLIQFIRTKKRYFTKPHYKIQHLTQINKKLDEIDELLLWKNLVSLTSFPNRSAKTSHGLATAHCLKNNFDRMAKEANRQDVDSYYIDSVRYQQPSVITVIGKQLSGKAVILGAHMDTLTGQKPGADDDASGSASLIEVARVLLKAKESMMAPVYIIWYAAEERGLVGSQEVVKYFIKNNISVNSVLQLDMTGWAYQSLHLGFYDLDNTIWMIDDFTNPELTNFIASLAEAYTMSHVERTRCGYACSDHAAWSREGYNTAFPFETKFGEHNPFIHTSTDDLSYLSLQKIVRHTKLSLAYALELAMINPSKQREMGGK